MKRVRTIAGSGVVLALVLSALMRGARRHQITHATDLTRYALPGCPVDLKVQPLMDQRVSQEIKRAWSEGENAAATMAFQENGEIAMSEGTDREAKRYFSRAERELATLEPEVPSE
jgi:hypothetical protein